MAHLLLFDLMDTVLVDPFFPAIRSFLDDEGIRTWVSLRTPGVFEAFEKGEISEREYFRRFFTTEELPSHIPPIHRLKKRMFQSVRFRPGLQDLLSRLAEDPGIKLGIASNYSAWYHSVLEKRPELERYFDLFFFSCEMGVRKPDPAYFDAIEASLPEFLPNPQSVWFFDDRPANLGPARKRGWNAHLIGIKSNEERDSAAIQEEFLNPLRQAGVVE